MFVGIALLEVLVPHSGSLKAKRSVVNSLKGRIQSRLKVSVSEVGDPELWQRASVAVAVVGSEVGRVEETLRSARRLAESLPDGRLIDFQSRVVPWRFEGPLRDE